MNIDEIIEKLDKEVKRKYVIKTAIYEDYKKVSEEIKEHREPFVTLTIDMADNILTLLKQQKETKTIVCPRCEEEIEVKWPLLAKKYKLIYGAKK